MDLVLASASPRRRDLLASLGLVFSVQSALGDGPIVAQQPDLRVLGHARFKAESLVAANPGLWILAADTLVYGNDCFFPKPLNRTHAESMLRALVALGEHDVWTGCCLFGPARQQFCRADKARVLFRAIPEAELALYLEGTEWCDKAGAYAIQGWAGQYATLVEGEFGTVVGLSESAVLALFHQASLSPDAFRR